ncbi:uncharacterized protein AB675_7534 [Cyphellophora attinorum]|uniref:C3H1-type domain-containing protein n=1 Tax=Cyphellophora attinorum TaxID=1664694 RepID=A0A0N1H9Z5_9EURO|nr:uncharacterized protein AB675_7534 [Phialophora attinorum]KPI40510.1 hypothetical protein AB675_7534 [Phialophora attinorum]
MADRSENPPLKAQFFVSREGGKYVPLVAMDEMPHIIIIEGVPRILDIEQTTGMVSIGYYESRHVLFAGGLADAGFKRNLDLPKSTNSLDEDDSNNNLATSTNTFNRGNEDTTTTNIDTLARGSEENTITESGIPIIYTGDNSVTRHILSNTVPANSSRPLSSSMHALTAVQASTGSTATSAMQDLATLTMPWRPSASQRDPIASSHPHITQATRSTSINPPLHPASSSPPSSAASTPKKTHCSKWLESGQCSYVQGAGCKFKHVMPLTLDELYKLGWRDIPQWYRDEHGLPSLIAPKGSDASKRRGEKKDGIHGKSWRPTQKQHTSPGKNGGGQRGWSNNSYGNGGGGNGGGGKGGGGKGGGGKGGGKYKRPAPGQVQSCMNAVTGRLAHPYYNTDSSDARSTDTSATSPPTSDSEDFGMGSSKNPSNNPILSLPDGQNTPRGAPRRMVEVEDDEKTPTKVAETKRDEKAINTRILELDEVDKTPAGMGGARKDGTDGKQAGSEDEDGISWKLHENNPTGFNGQHD